MNAFLLKNLYLRRWRFISVDLNQCYLPELKKHYLKPYLSIINNTSLTSHRNFSFVGFYSAIAQSSPVLSLQNVLIDFHQSSSLPWWAVIMLTTLSIRTLIVFPLSVHQNQVISRIANVNVEIGQLAPELNKEVNIAKAMYKWDEGTAKKVFRRQLRELHNKRIVRDNCHPFKMILLSLFQIPAWICLSISIRNLTLMSLYMHPIPDYIKQLKSEGILWFPDLTSPDMLFIPLLLMTVNLALIEAHALRQVGKGTLFRKVLLNSSRLITVVIAIAATVSPSSVTFYWLCSSTLGLCQNVLLMFPKVRRMLRIPSTASESSTPFKDIANNFKKRFKT